MVWALFSFFFIYNVKKLFLKIISKNTDKKEDYKFQTLKIFLKKYIIGVNPYYIAAKLFSKGLAKLKLFSKLCSQVSFFGYEACSVFRCKEIIFVSIFMFN